MPGPGQPRPIISRFGGSGRIGPVYRPRRTVAFGSFGLFYLGGVQYFIYVPLFSRLFPNAAAFAGKPKPRSNPNRGHGRPSQP